MRKEIIKKILEEWNVCSCDNSALADRLLDEFSPAGEYISKEDISRVLLARTNANKSCLSNAKELKNHEAEQYFDKLVFEDEQITSLIEELPSASFPDSAENKGEWIKLKNGYKCSECGHIMDKVLSVSGNLIYQYSNYCPECGKKMT